MGGYSGSNGSTMVTDNLIPLSVDWLALSLRLEAMPVGCPEGHRWAYYTQTNVWASRWALFNEFGDKVFTLLFQPRQSILHPRTALLEVANEWLYHGIGFGGVLSLLGQCVRFRVTGISRLDLAADFNPDEHQEEVIRSLADGRMYVGNKRNRVPWFSTIHDAALPTRWQGETPHSHTWGHKTTDVRWKLYYKTKELRDAAGGKGFDKPYIVDMWKEYGLNVTDVWRLEVSVHNCNNFNFMGDKLTYERFCKSGSDLYQALYTSRFQVHRNEGHKDRSNDSEVEFLPVGRLSGAFKVRRSEALTEHNGRLTLLRHMYHDIMEEQVLISDVAREAVLDAMEQIIEEDRFHRYFVAMAGQSFEEWREWLRVKAYYFGVENLKPIQDDGSKMEMAMLDAGLVTDHTPPPLGATSSMSPQRSATIQTKILFNP